MQIKINKIFLISTLAPSIAVPSVTQAASVEDAKGNLSLRNFCINRDYRDSGLSGGLVHKGKTQSQSEDWGQSFMLRLQSGYTKGTVGIGIDGLGLPGTKLDSGAGTGGSGTLVRSCHMSKSGDRHAFLGLTAKSKVSETVITVGTHEPVIPIAFRNDTRLMPQTFQGGQVQFKDIEHLTLTAGQFQKVRLRDSTNYKNMIMAADGATGGIASNKFNYAGASFEFIPSLTGTYFYTELKDNYNQYHVNLQLLTNLTRELKFKTDLRYFKSSDKGNTNIDSRLVSGMFPLSYVGHLGYQNGGGTAPWTMNTSIYYPFLRAKEDSWQIRYDFAQIGVPGLNLMARYVSGDNFKVAGKNAKERERDIDLGCTIQSGLLKDVSLLMRNVMSRGSHTTDID